MRLRILGKGPFHSTQMILRVRNPTPRALVGRLLAPARPGAYLDVVSGPAPTVRGVVPPEGYALAIGPLGPGEAAEVRASWNQDLRRGPGGLVRHHLDLPAAAGPYAARVDVAWTGATHHPAQGTGWMAEAAEVRGNQAFESRVRLDGTDGASYRLDLRVEPGEVRPDGPRPPDPAPPILPPWSELAPRPEALGPAASTPRAASLAPPAEVARPPAGPSPEATVRPPSTTDDGRVEVYLGTRKTLVRPWMPGPSGSR